MEYKLLDFSMVLLGDIPASLFTPAWLSKHKLISEEEGEKANVQIISPQVTNFQIPEWARFDINSNKLSIATYNDSHHEVIRDIILSMLRVLEGNNITNMGINHNFHFNLTLDQYLEIGKTLAPFENWEGILDEPRMLNLEMIQESRFDSYSGRYRIKVQPSAMLDGVGASFNINSHYNREGKKEDSAQEFSELINETWDKCKIEAKNFLEQFWKNIDL